MLNVYSKICDITTRHILSTAQPFILATLLCKPIYRCLLVWEALANVNFPSVILYWSVLTEYNLLDIYLSIKKMLNIFGKIVNTSHFNTVWLWPVTCKCKYVIFPAHAFVQVKQVTNKKPATVATKEDDDSSSSSGEEEEAPPTKKAKKGVSFDCDDIMVETLYNRYLWDQWNILYMEVSLIQAHKKTHFRCPLSRSLSLRIGSTIHTFALACF